MKMLLCALPFEPLGAEQRPTLDSAVRRTAHHTHCADRIESISILNDGQFGTRIVPLGPLPCRAQLLLSRP